MNFGYISLNSYPSPSIATCRLSAVVCTPFIALRCRCAWTVSASAAALNNLATCGKPSSSAFFANARYAIRNALARKRINQILRSRHEKQPPKLLIHIPPAVRLTESLLPGLPRRSHDDRAHINAPRLFDCEPNCARDVFGFYRIAEPAL